MPRLFPPSTTKQTKNNRLFPYPSGELVPKNQHNCCFLWNPPPESHCVKSDHFRLYALTAPGLFLSGLCDWNLWGASPRLPHVARKAGLHLWLLVSLIKKKLRANSEGSSRRTPLNLKRKILGQTSCKYQWLPRKEYRKERKRENHAIYKQFHGRKRLRGNK